jgi:chemotaxis protein MotB
MKKIIVLLVAFPILFTSCVPQKKYAALETQQKETQELLNSATVKLNACLDEKAATDASIAELRKQNQFLIENNQDLINNMGNLTTLTKKGADNLERSLESLKEKDLTIRRMQDAVTRRDSVTLALVTALKSSLVDINDSDIEINVEKGVVFISISDKMIFNSGSNKITARAKEVLGKVAKIINDKPEFEFMVEGHTDDRPISNDLFEDNWDLSVDRATSIVRVLQKEFGVAPERMIAAGRSSYIPVDDNETASGRANNRRIRIVLLPKLDQFYSLLDEAMAATTE